MMSTCRAVQRQASQLTPGIGSEQPPCQVGTCSAAFLFPYITHSANSLKPVCFSQVPPKVSLFCLLCLLARRSLSQFSSVSDGSELPVWISPVAGSALINASRLKEGLWRGRWNSAIRGYGDAARKSRPERIPPGACVPANNQQVAATARGKAPAERCRTGTMDPQACPGFEQRLGVAETSFVATPPPFLNTTTPLSLQTPAESLPPPLIPVGSSLRGAGKGGGAQRCSDLPGPCKAGLRPQHFPAQTPASRPLGEGGVRRLHGEIQGHEEGEEFKAGSATLSDAPSLPRPHRPRTPRDVSVCRSLHPCFFSFFLSFFSQLTPT